MRNPPLDPKQFGLLRALDQFSRSLGLNLSDKKGLEKFIQHLSDTANAHQKNKILIHGLRIQTMFAYFAAALGGCKIITEEDSGDFYAETSEVKRPDFRIVSHQDQEFFVEVKNFNQKDPLQPYVLEEEYVNQLTRYAQIFGKPLLIAIYWRRWGMWTLNSLKCFKHEGKHYSILLTETAKNDQKQLLGDRLIGISKPLIFRIYTDPSYSRKVDEKGHCQFRIEKVALMAAGREIEDKMEQRLAWYFFLYGAWTDVEQPANIVDGELLWIDMEPIREDPNPDQNFLMIGSLSEMICRQFNSATTNKGKVTRLMPDKKPDKFGIQIPAGFKGDALGVWQFALQADEKMF
jgi:Holliday junction resolvase